MARRLRPRWLGALVLLAVVLAACSGSGPDKPSLETRKVTVGGLEVIIEPTRLDATAAEFAVTFDTHTGAPDIDVAHEAALTVDGTDWTGATWSGDGPGGHHREGTLRFTAAGPAAGTARLRINGLEGPVEATWTLASEG